MMSCEGELEVEAGRKRMGKTTNERWGCPWVVGRPSEGFGGSSEEGEEAGCIYLNSDGSVWEAAHIGF